MRREQLAVAILIRCFRPSVVCDARHELTGGASALDARLASNRLHRGALDDAAVGSTVTGSCHWRMHVRPSKPGASTTTWYGHTRLWATRRRPPTRRPTQEANQEKKSANLSSGPVCGDTSILPDSRRRQSGSSSYVSLLPGKSG